MKTIKLIIPALFILFLVSCKPVVTTLSDDYVGYWESSGASGYYAIEIASNGSATYQGFKGITTVTSSGKARLRGNKFKIGLKKFKFDQGPTLDISGYWTMILDDITYYRI